MIVEIALGVFFGLGLWWSVTSGHATTLLVLVWRLATWPFRTWGRILTIAASLGLLAAAIWGLIAYSDAERASDASHFNPDTYMKHKLRRLSPEEAKSLGLDNP
jgi:hypothetical protein